MTDQHDRAADGQQHATRPLLADAALMMRLVELADSLQRDGTVDFPATIRAINAGAVEMVGGAQYAGITVVEADGAVTSLGPTHRFPALLDTAHADTGNGPSLTAAREQQLIRVPDLHQDARWPEFRQHVLARTSIRSILCVPMVVGDLTLAALSFQAEQPDAFTDESAEMAVIMAAHAAMAWNLRLREQQFNTALDSRDIIGQAKGMLMERFNIDAIDAFELLRKLSQETNTKLSVLAENIVSQARSDQASGD